MKYEITSINNLKPLEKVFPNHLRNLEKMIDSDGYVLKAIIADKTHGVILDGSHRYAYFLKRGYKEVPVHWVDYGNDSVRVGTKLKHRFLIDGCVYISKEECIKRALTGDLFLPRTTRHFFTFRKSDITLPLSELKKGKPNDISHLIYDCEIMKEISHNEKYIGEIDEENEIIIKYLFEIAETKQYLLQQISDMKNSMKVAFFPGKFHPPHLGHIQTILKLMGKYKKVIVCVSGHVPDDAITTPQNIFAEIKKFFNNNEDIDVIFLDEILVEKKDLTGLPKFDVLLSGNQDVLDWAEKQNIKGEFMARSEGFLFSGTEMRNIIREEEK